MADPSGFRNQTGLSRSVLSSLDRIVSLGYSVRQVLTIEELRSEEKGGSWPIGQKLCRAWVAGAAWQRIDRLWDAAARGDCSLRRAQRNSQPDSKPFAIGHSHAHAIADAGAGHRHPIGDGLAHYHADLDGHAAPQPDADGHCNPDAASHP